MALSKKRKAVLQKLKQFCYDNDVMFSSDNNSLVITVGISTYTAADGFCFDETDVGVVDAEGNTEIFIDELGDDEF